MYTRAMLRIDTGFYIRLWALLNSHCLPVVLLLQLRRWRCNFQSLGWLREFERPGCFELPIPTSDQRCYPPYVCMFGVWMWVSADIYIYMYTRTYLYHVCTNVYKYVDICTDVEHVAMYVCVYACMYVYACVQTYACTCFNVDSFISHTHSHIHMHARELFGVYIWGCQFNMVRRDEPTRMLSDSPCAAPPRKSSAGRFVFRSAIAKPSFYCWKRAQRRSCGSEKGDGDKWIVFQALILKQHHSVYIWNT